MSTIVSPLHDVPYQIGNPTHAGSDRFNPAFSPLDPSFVLSHAASKFTRTPISGTKTTFENMGRFPEFPLQATWYDALQQPRRHQGGVVNTKEGATVDNKRDGGRIPEN